MKTEINYKISKKFLSGLLLMIMPFGYITIDNASATDKVVYPLKKISKLECRFEDFDTLSSSCKQNLPILNTKNYRKYIKLNGGFNDYTRIYTVLWGGSYKYGWDVGNGGHIGTDIATAKGTPVYAMSDGKVTIAKTLVSYGNSITIKHTINGKDVFSTYSHLSLIGVKKGQKIKAGEKIGEVGSTGNSTGNHLHFQIDLDTSFHPYYYDYEACPYSYNKISESSVCFSELKKNTIDPLLFLETNGGVLDDITIQKISRDDIVLTEKTTSSSKSSSSFDYSIFNRTVYFGYSSSDIKEVQNIFRDLGEYKGQISGNYKDVEEHIISYQLSNNIIGSDTESGAGRFGPKTRAQVKHDYENFLANGGKRIEVASDSDDVIVKNNVKTEIISNSGMLSREEIEIKEVETFLRKNDIQLKLENIGGNISVGGTMIMKLEIKGKSGRYFKGNIPSGMTFTVDSTKVNVFPTRLYNFTDGKRNIKLTGLKTGTTTLYVKIGSKVIKSFNLNVFSSGKTIYPEYGSIYTNKSIVLSDKKTGIILFKDKNGRKLIKLSYGGEYMLKASEGTEICIKRGTIGNISKIYKTDCKEEDYVKQVKFNYSDTVGGLLLFDYKVFSKDVKIELINLYGNKTLSTKSIAVTDPKGLKKDYVYKDEVVDLLSEGILTGINKGYFLEDRGLVEGDAMAWIGNTLIRMKDEVISKDLETKINKSISEIEKKRVSKFNTVTREEFLDLAYKYLVFEDNNSQVSIKYRDLETADNVKANAIFDKNNTWKDQFGENYYRPKVEITRGEGAYFLAKVIERNKKIFLTLK